MTATLAMSQRVVDRGLGRAGSGGSTFIVHPSTINHRFGWASGQPPSLRRRIARAVVGKPRSPPERLIIYLRTRDGVAQLD
jgi:hypothetical protein